MKPFKLEVNNPLEKNTIFSTPGNFKQFSTISRPWTISLPTSGASTFYTVTHGTGLFDMFHIDQMCDFGYSLEQFPAYLEVLEEKMLSHKKIFTVEAGRSIFVPYGWIPLIAGIGPHGNQKKKHNKYGTLLYIVYPILDSMAALNALPVVRTEVTIGLHRLLTRNPKTPNPTHPQT